MSEMNIEIPNGFPEAFQVVDTFVVRYEAKGWFRIELVKVLAGIATTYMAHYYEERQGAWHRMGGPTSPGYVATDGREMRRIKRCIRSACTSAAAGGCRHQWHLSDD